MKWRAANYEAAPKNEGGGDNNGIVDDWDTILEAGKSQIPFPLKQLYF
jgi:hypothetical protein